jgi:hypothetical protein
VAESSIGSALNRLKLDHERAEAVHNAPGIRQSIRPSDPEHLERFRKVMTALVAVPKDEAFRAFVRVSSRSMPKLGQ